MYEQFATQEGAQIKATERDPDIKFFFKGGCERKTEILFREALTYYLEPNFKAIVICRGHLHLLGNGGIWDAAKDLYPKYGATANLSSMTFTFPSGASVQFACLDNEEDVYKHAGAQYDLIAWEELQHFTEFQFNHINARLLYRLESKPCIIATYSRSYGDRFCPNWTDKYLGKYFDKTDCLIKGREGKVYYFVKDGNEIHIGDSEEEVKGKFPKLTSEVDSNGVPFHRSPVRTFCLEDVTEYQTIPSHWSLNQLAEAKGPHYEEIVSLPKAERDVLLLGSITTHPTKLFEKTNEKQFVPTGSKIKL